VALEAVVVLEAVLLVEAVLAAVDSVAVLAAADSLVVVLVATGNPNAFPFKTFSIKNRSYF
jgi:hypothetical protein